MRAGHVGPHRLQHLLSRAAWDDRQVLERAAEHLDDVEAILIVDETADAKSSADAAGAARQYSGTLGGIALCQVAVTLTYASSRGHALSDQLLEYAHQQGIRAGFVTGDEVYGGRELRQAIRARGMGYVLAVRANTTITPGTGQGITATGAMKLIPDRSWQRLRAGSGTKGTRHYDRAMLEITADDTPEGQDNGHSLLLIRYADETP